MSYKSKQYENAKKFKKSLQDREEIEYTVPVEGKPKPFEHFFKKTKLNLWEHIRNNAVDYFKKKGIIWHTNKIENNPDTEPEGNMLSSQISCLNHLFLLRENPDYASATLKNIDNRIVSAKIVRDGYGDDGYIEFEAWGTSENNNPLREKSSKRKRGEKSTSIDAVMVGRKDDGKNILVLIEWKFVEDYTKDYGDEKFKYHEGYHDDIYGTLLNEENCPIHRIENSKDFYYEPFYQLMRQTLWGWKAAKDYCCDEYIHLHIIPRENLAIQEITSPNLKNMGSTMSEVWKNLLKEPLRYKVISPEELLSPLKNNQNFMKDNQELKDLFAYLERRYLEKYCDS